MSELIVDVLAQCVKCPAGYTYFVSNGTHMKIGMTRCKLSHRLSSITHDYKYHDFDKFMFAVVGADYEDDMHDLFIGLHDPLKRCFGRFEERFRLPYGSMKAARSRVVRYFQKAGL